MSKVQFATIMGSRIMFSMHMDLELESEKMDTKLILEILKKDTLLDMEDKCFITVY